MDVNFLSWQICVPDGKFAHHRLVQTEATARQLRPTDYSGTCLRRLCSVCVLTRITNACATGWVWVWRGSWLPSSAQCSFRVCCFQSKHWLPLIWMSDKCISSHQTHHHHHILHRLLLPPTPHSQPLLILACLPASPLIRMHHDDRTELLVLQPPTSISQFPPLLALKDMTWHPCQGEQEHP